MRFPAPEVPQAWREVASVEKEPIGWPEWSTPEAPAVPKDGRTPRGELRSTAGARIEVVIPLAKVGGAGIEGARLRLLAHADRREWEVTATLEVEGGRSFVCIARVDAWPPDPHKTVHRELCRRLGIPSEVESHHVHRFEDNALRGLEAFRNGMPLARPIEGGNMSFRRFMEIVCAEFHVTGLEEFPPPPTWGSLL